MKILEPIKVGNMTLKNRIMFPPMTTGYEERDGSISKQSLNFYKRLAEGGTAYIVLGDVAPVNTASPTPKLFADHQIEAFKELADALHEFDCKLGLQLFHPEYDVAGIGKMIAEAGLCRKQAMEAKQAGDEGTFASKMAEAEKVTKQAYGALHYQMQHYVDEVTEDQLNEILAQMKLMVQRAKKAGVDAIEVHGDRLVGSLCSKTLNHRSDEYGGSLENRARFALNVIKTIKEAAPDMVIDYKLPVVTVNADGSLRGKGGLEIDEAIEFAKMAEAAGVDMFHVGQANHTGNMNDTIPVMGTMPYVFMKKYCKAIKDVVSVPVSTVGRIIDIENGEALIENGICDIIGYGRSLLCDPDMVNKTMKGQQDRIRKCMSCNKGCTDAIMSRRFISCVLNAENGYEYDRVIRDSDHKKKVVIVGAGLAGLEAARVAAIKGHDVILFDQESRIGGQLNIASVPPRKKEMYRSVDYYANELKALNVDLRLNIKATTDVLLKEQPDAVIIATGAKNAIPNIEGANLLHVKSAWDILDGKQLASGEVVVIGGGLVGAETAEYLATQGAHVTIVEMQDEIAKEESSTVKPTLNASFIAHDVTLMPSTTVKKITKEAVVVNTSEGEKEVACDYVIIATGAKPVLFDTSAFVEQGIAVSVVGDANEKAADINKAVEEGYLAANAL